MPLININEPHANKLSTQTTLESKDLTDINNRRTGTGVFFQVMDHGLLEFRVTLLDTPQQPNEPTSPGERSSGDLRVLLVDDAQIILDRLSTALSRIERVQVVGTSHDSKSAVERINQQRPDLLILDIRMRASNGWEVLQYIKDSQLNLSVFVFSNDSSKTSRSRFLAGGAQKFFDKSLDFDELREAVQALATQR